MKKFGFLLMASFLLVLSACGSGEVETLEIEEVEAKEKEEKAELEEEKVKIKEEKVKIKEEKVKIKEEKAKIEEEKAKMAENKIAEEINETTNDFDELPIAIRAHLAASIVDDRAKDNDLTGYTLYYNIEEDKLFVQVHSGAGVGHPVYKIQIDSDSITPIDGVVNVSAAEIEETTVNSSSIQKKDLYNSYSEYKNIYESGQINVEQDDSLVENYKWMKDQMQ